jgi:hypothetical protein
MNPRDLLGMKRAVLSVLPAIFRETHLELFAPVQGGTCWFPCFQSAPHP